MAKTLQEKIQLAQEKVTQSENQLKQLLQTQKEEERKARTKRLIERGALLESLMGVTDNVTHEQIREALAVMLGSDVGRKAMLPLREQAIASSAKTQETSTGGGA